MTDGLVNIDRGEQVPVEDKAMDDDRGNLEELAGQPKSDPWNED